MARRHRRRRRKVHAPHVRHRRRRVRARRRRRSNPVPVVFANPRRRRRRRVRARHVGGRRRRRLFAPRRRRHGRRRHRAYRPTMRLHRRRRRSNPGMLRLGRWGGTLKMAIFGGLGIVTARVGGHLYDKFLQKTVEGDAKSGARAWLGKAARLASMGIIVVAVDKGLKMARVSPANCLAFKVGGIAEVGRQVIGMAVKGLKPSTDLANWGLNGFGGGSGYFRQLSPGSYRTGFGELETEDSFLGDGLEDIDSFDGSGGGGHRASTRTVHPFAAAY